VLQYGFASFLFDSFDLALRMIIVEGGNEVLHEQREAVVHHAHERFYAPILGRSVASHNLIVQPENRGTAPATLYSLLRLAATTPFAQVAIFPSDHFIDDDHKFMRHVERAFAATALRPELIVLLGIAPQWAETAYGWIEPGAVIGDTPVFQVYHFWEKPRSDLAGELLGRGCVWNSFVMVGQLSALLGLFLIALPELYWAFNKIRPVIGTTFEEKTLGTPLRGSSINRFLGTGPGGASSQLGSPSGTGRRVERFGRAASRYRYDRPNRGSLQRYAQSL
jgi:hypothetical protein